MIFFRHIVGPSERIDARPRGALVRALYGEQTRFFVILALIVMGWSLFFSTDTTGEGERRVKEVLLLLVKIGYVAFLWSIVLFAVWALLQELRGMRNWRAVEEDNLDAVERRHPYLPGLRQIVLAFLLVFTLPFFIWSAAARTAVAIEAGVETLEPYAYVEQRAWQIANDAVGSIAGTVYTDEGTTVIGANKTVNVSLNGGTAAGTDETDAGGQYVITGLTMTGGTIVSVYLDNETEDAVTVTLGSGSSMTGLHLYHNRLIVRSDSGSVALTNAHLNIANNNGDSDITAIYNVDANNILQVAADKELYVWTGDSYAPGARIRTHDLEVKGTLSLSTNGLTVTGSLVANAGTFTTATGITLGSIATSETLNLGTNAIKNLSINNGLVGYWKFDEGVGTVAKDSSGNGNDGTLTNGPIWSTTVPSTRFYNPNSLSFDGVNDYVSVPDSDVFSFVNSGQDLPMTVAAWVRMTDATKFAIAAKVVSPISSSSEWFFGTVPGDIVSWTMYGGGGTTNNIYQGSNSAVTSDQNQWIHLVGTYNGSETNSGLKIYRNGTLLASTGGSNGAYAGKANTAAPVEIGAGFRGDATYFEWANGLIDDVRIYNRALSASEIATLASGYAATGSGTYTLGANLALSGNLDIRSGTLDVSGSSHGVTLSGNFLNVAGFTARSGTVTFDGTLQTISGSTVFSGFEKSITAATTLFLDPTSRQSVSGSLVLQGTAGNLLSIRSTRSGSGARIFLDGDSGTQTVQYLNVKDSNATGGSALVCYTGGEGCTDAGNNTNWTFAQTYSLAGTVYTDEGTTVIGANKTVNVSLNGGTAAGTDETDAGGQYVITGLTMTGGTIVSVYLDNETEDAVTVTLGSGSSMTGLHLYHNRLIVRSDSGSVALTNAHLNVANNNGDSDITAIYNVDASTILQVAADKELYVWTGDSYAPGARIRTHDLEVKGTLSLSTNGLTVTGSLVANAGTFTTATGITLGSIATSETLNLGTNAIKNLSINNGLVGYWKFDEGVGTVAKDSSGNGNDGTLTNGPIWSSTVPTTRFYNPKSLSFDGVNDYVPLPEADVLRLGTKSFTISAWFKTGASGLFQSIIVSDNGVSGAGWFLRIDNTNKVFGYLVSVGRSILSVASTQTVTDGSWHFVTWTRNAGAQTHAMYVDGVLSGGPSSDGAFDVTSNAGVYASIGRAGAFNGQYFNGLIDDVRIYNRALSASEIATLASGYATTGSGTYTLGANLALSGNLDIRSGTLDVSGSSHGVTLSGNFLNVAGFTARSGTVTFDGTLQTISGSTVFSGFEKSITAATTLFLDPTSRQSVSGSLVLQGTAGNLLSIRSTRSGSGARILLDGDSGTQTVQYLNVKDSNATGGSALVCYTSSEGCVNNGGNTNWAFTPTYTITGTVYSDEGATSIGSAKTVAISLDGDASAGTSDTDAGGQYTITGMSMPAGTVITLYLDNETEKAVTVTLGSGSTMTGVHLYQNRLIARSDSDVVALTNAHLNIANNNGDSDITAIYNVDANNILQVAADKELYVWAGDSYTPGARIRTHDLEVKGTLSLSTNGLTVTGSLVANAGTFTTATGITLGSIATSETLNLGTNAIKNLSINNGLVGYWKFDEGVGTVAKDSSGNGNDGTLTNGPIWSTTVPSTRFYNPNSLSFDGANDFVSLPANSSLNITGAITMSTWIKTTTTAIDVFIGGYQDSNPYLGYGWCMGCISTGKPSYWSGGYGSWTSASSAVNDNAWNHIAVVVASGTARFYKNGIADGTSTSAVPNSYSGTRYIGSNGSVGNAFAGNLDDVRIYNRALSASEIATLASGYATTGSGTYTLGANLALSGNLDIRSGTLDVSGSSHGVTLSGNFLNVAGFTARSGTVTFDGTLQTISGSTVFSGFEKSITAATTLFLDPTSRQSVSGSLVLQGTAGNLLSIRSTRSGSGARILLDGDSGTQTVQYLNVKDSNATGGSALVCYTGSEGCTDAGNNTNWTFAQTYSLAGTVYTDEGTTVIGANKTVNVSLNGGTAAGTDETDAGGQYVITGLTMTGGTIVSVYLDNETEDAVTVTLGSGSSMTGLHLYHNRLIVRSDSGSVALTNAHLNVANNNGDSDITAIYNVDASTILQVAADKELYVWTGDSYAPGARIRTHDLEVKGTLSLSTNGLTVTGSLVANAGTFTTATGITLGSIATSETLNLGTNAIKNLSINNGLVGYWKFDEGVGTVAKDSSGNGNDGTLTNGPIWSSTVPTTRFYNPKSLSFDGVNDYVNAGNGSALNIDGDVTVSAWVNTNGYNFASNLAIIDRFDGSRIPYALSATENSGDMWWFAIFDGTNAPAVGSIISFNTNWHHITGMRHQASDTIKLYVDGVLTSAATDTTAGSLSTNTNTYIGARLQGGLQRAFPGLIDDVRIYNRALSASEIATLASGYATTGSGTYTLGANLALSGNLDIRSGTLDVSGSSHGVTLSGNFLNVAGFTARSGTVTFDGTLQTISGSTVFSGFEKSITAATTLFLDPTSRQSVSGSLVLQGTAGNLLSIRSTRSGSGARILLDGDSGTQTVQYLNVKDSNATGGSALVCYTGSEGCTDAGNNTNWTFAQTYSLAGTVYTDEGTTVIGANKTVNVSLNGGTAAGTDETDAGGQYVITGLTMTGGTIVSVYLDNETEDAVTVTLGSGSSMTGLHLYHNRLIVRSDSGSVALTNAHLNIANNNGDSDITAIYNVDANNILQVAADKELYVWTGDSTLPVPASAPTTSKSKERSPCPPTASPSRDPSSPTQAPSPPPRASRSAALPRVKRSTSAPTPSRT
jgi:formylmethanofuran dehydrogenase subunit C